MISECCHAEDKVIENGPNYSEINECPLCGEHCGWLYTEDEMKGLKGKIYELEQVVNALTS